MEEEKVKELELKLQNCECLTSEELNDLWGYKTKK